MTSERDAFEYWLDYMDDALDEFFAELPGRMVATLDYSVESLDILEAWLLERYADPDEAIADTETLFLDGAARYIGETFRKKLGGYWTVDLEHYTYRGLPQLTGFPGRPTRICPLALATASTDRRRGNFISTILRNNIAKYVETD